MTKLCFTLELLNRQYNDAILLIFLHLCWNDIENTKFFMEELMFSANIQKNNMNDLTKRLKMLRAILQLKDNLQEARMEIVCGLESLKETEEENKTQTKESDKALLSMAQAHQVEYPLFSLEVVKIVSDMCSNAQLLLYFTKHKSKIVWVREFLDHLKETLPHTYQTFRSSSTMDIED